jgi:hypothetical protein
MDAGVLHDVVAWYCLTIFCRSTPRVGHQVGDTHEFHLSWRFGCLMVYGPDMLWIRALFVICVLGTSGIEPQH